MLYSSYRGAGGTFRGKTWKLPNGYWRSCNHNGQQCTFKIWNEALRFADKGKPLSENKEITLQAVRTRHEAAAMAKHAENMTNVISTSVKELRNGHFQPVLVMKEGKLQEVRMQSHYMPELSRREMSYLASNLVKQGYNVKVKGPNLVTDAPEEQIQATFGPGISEVNEAKSSFTLHAMGNGWSHSKTISASSQKEAEVMFRKDPRFQRQARQAGEKWKEVPIVGDREARSKFGKVKKTQEPDMSRSAFLGRTKGPPSAAPRHYPPSPSAARRR